MTVLVLLLFVKTDIRAQDLATDALKFNSKFEKNVTFQYQEKVFIHTDRDIYVTGETIWLSAFCVDAALHTPSGLSKVLSLEILGSDGNVFKQDRIQLIKGFGHGQLFVSPDIPSGTYVLRAYTNWMKNFDPGFVFHKRITIVNPSAPPTVDEGSDKYQEITVDFFPEGGDLVLGLESKVAVKVTNAYGEGINLKGSVLDQEGNEVAEFSTSRHGYASFQLAPEDGKKYRVSIDRAGAIRTYELPQAKLSGVVLTVTDEGSQDLNIGIKATPNFKKYSYLVVHTRGIINRFERVALDLQENILLKKDILDAGITHITLLGDKFTPLAERLVFRYPDAEPRLNVVVGTNDYGRREKVTIAIDKDKLGVEGELAKLSVSVYRIEGVNVREDNIADHLLLASDLKGTIQDMGSYFNPANENMEHQMDLLMLTNGWRRFSWQDVVGDHEGVEPEHPAELNAPILSGQLLNYNTLIESVQMNFIGRASVLNSMNLEADGKFAFEVPFRIKNEEVQLIVEYDTLRENQVLLHSPFDLPYTPDLTRKMKLNPDRKAYLEGLNSNIQLSQVYRSYNYINGSDIASAPLNTHFYGKPDFVYRLDDYTRFETMEDLFIEYIALIYIRKQYGQRTFHVAGDYLLPGKALVMMDGLPIEDFDFVMAFDPLKIEKIELVNRNYYIGDLSYAGLINFTTYKGNFAREELPQNLLKKAYHALQNEREFYCPDYNDANIALNRIPDYRNTLYWNPDVSLGHSETMTLEFYTSDDIGTYQIQINGITNSGAPFYGSQSFNVENH